MVSIIPLISSLFGFCFFIVMAMMFCNWLRLRFCPRRVFIDYSRLPVTEASQKAEEGLRARVKSLISDPSYRPGALYKCLGHEPVVARGIDETLLPVLADFVTTAFFQHEQSSLLGKTTRKGMYQHFLGASKQWLTKYSIVCCSSTGELLAIFLVAKLDLSLSEEEVPPETKNFSKVVVKLDRALAAWVATKGPERYEGQYAAHALYMPHIPKFSILLGMAIAVVDVLVKNGVHVFVGYTNPKAISFAEHMPPDAPKFKFSVKYKDEYGDSAPEGEETVHACELTPMT